MKIRTISRAAFALCGAAALAGAAHAGVIAGSGLFPSRSQLGETDAVAFKVVEGQAGHALLVPYFTAQNGQMSVIHLVNTDTDNGKVVKVRFRGANNGDRLLNVHVLLAPGDVWTAAVTAGPDGVAQLTTNDRTCTLPKLALDEPQSFSTDRLDAAWSAETKAAHTREGAIEAIVMADVPQAKVYGSDSASNSALFNSINPVAGVAPCTTQDSDVNDALLQDITGEPAAASRGLATPTGQVAATWYVIDVPGSTTFSGAATAVQAVNNAGLPARGNYLVFPPTDDVVAQPERYTADPLLVSAGLAFRAKDAQGNTALPTTAAALQAVFNDLPDLSTPVYLPATADSARATAGDLSRLLAVRQFKNQFTIEDSIAARTDWVMAMPTKRYSVGKDYSQRDAGNQRVYSVVPPAGTGSQYFHALNTEIGQSVCNLGRSWGMRMVNRESVTSFKPAPPAVEDYESCGAVSVLSFNSEASALGSSINHRSVSNAYSTGWASMQVPDAGGLPIIGASFIKLSNPNATPGVAANYGLTFPYIVKKP